MRCNYNRSYLILLRKCGEKFHALILHQTNRLESPKISLVFLFFYSIDQGTNKSTNNKTKMKFHKKISNQLALNRIFL
jgi:hypothetical protein